MVIIYYLPLSPSSVEGCGQGKSTIAAICGAEEIESDGEMDTPLQHFADLKDPRLPRKRRHLLIDIVLISLAAILSGAEGWDDMETKSWRRCDTPSSFQASLRCDPRRTSAPGTCSWRAAAALIASASGLVS